MQRYREKVFCKNNVNSLSGVEAPREAGWSLYRELERWTVYQSPLEEKWGESKRGGEKENELPRFLMSLSLFNRAEERGEKGKESV